MYDFKASHAFLETFDISPYQEGALSGLTFAVKDTIDVAGYKTGGGNPTWAKDHPKAVVHAVCVEELLIEGARCLGKTITDELAFGLLGENHFYGTPINPKAPDRIPGGSSSGSASAVACGIVDFALGTDAGGSVRVPSSNCGIFGFRPSHGRISLAGINPFAPSFDTVGVLAKNGDILRKAAHVLLGTSPTLQKPKKIYILDDAFSMSDPEVRDGLKNALELFPFTRMTLKELLHGEITFEDLFATFCALQWSEVWSTLGSWIESAKPEFGPGPSRSFALAKNFQRKDILKNIQMRMKIKKKLNDFLQNGYLLCIPTTCSLAPKKGSVPLDRTQGNYYPRLLSLTSLSGLASLPQISLPVGSYEGIPVGLSFLAAWGHDELLFGEDLLEHAMLIGGSL
jgi:amidase